MENILSICAFGQGLGKMRKGRTDTRQDGDCVMKGHNEPPKHRTIPGALTGNGQGTTACTLVRNYCKIIP